MRPVVLLALPAALLVSAACGGKAVIDAGIGGGGSSSVATSDIATTDVASTSTGETCPPHSSPGCCPGDGGCCDCVAAALCQGNPFSTPTDHPAQLPLDECLCRADVCGTVCDSACAGQGIDVGCHECAQAAALNQCLAEYQACPEGPN